MSIIARYVFRQALSALLLILLSLTGVVWIALALKQLNLVTSQGQDTWRLLAMTTLAVPNLIGLIAPVALLIAVIHVLNRLNTDSELIVLTASGATVWTIARPLLLLATLVSVGVALVNHFAMPWSLRTLRSFIVEVRTDLLAQVIQPGRFTSPESGLTFHIRHRGHDGVLQGILMHDTRDQKQQVSYLAERGTIQRQDKQAFLTMTNGHILRRTDGDEPVQIIAFGRYAIDLDQFDQKSDGPVVLKPREMYTGELLAPDPKSAAAKRTPGHIRAELHERFANPLYPFAFVLIALAFVGQAQSTRQRRAESVVVAFILAAGARIAGLGVNNVVVLNAETVPVLYAIPIGAALVGLLMMRINARPRGGRSILGRLIDGAGDLVRRPRTGRAQGRTTAGSI